MDPDPEVRVRPRPRPRLARADSRPSRLSPPHQSVETSMRPPTNYAAFVTGVLGDMTHQSAAVDQRVLCHCLELASSYLVTDATMNSANGISTWITGFSRLVSVLEALHIRGELELDTVNAASKACSECWTVAGSWRDLHDSREGVRGVAGRLKRLLDENGRTFQGARVYVP